MPDQPAAKLAVLIDAGDAPASRAQEALDQDTRSGTARIKRACDGWIGTYSRRS
jgi:hypothetical protein